MKKLTLFSICLIVFCRAIAQTGIFISSDRFSSSLISDLCQDHQGSIWIATDYGLNRYDGYHFQTFLHDNADTTSICNNMVVSLLCDSRGRLWAGTSRGLDRFDLGSETFKHFHFPDGVVPRVSSIIEQRDGQIIIGTAGYGIYTISTDDKLSVSGSTPGHGYYSRIFEDSRGRKWWSGFDETIHMRDGQRNQQFHSTLGNPQAFAEINGEVLVLCLHGFMSYRNGKMQEADIDMGAIEEKDILFAKTETSPNNMLYIGTRGNGIYRVDFGTTAKASESRASRRLERLDVNAFDVDPQTAKISALLCDVRGNLWIACDRKGLIMLPLRPVQFANWSFQAQGINLGTTISSVCEGDNGMTWCTVQGVGIYGFNRQGRVVAHPQSPKTIEFIFRDRQRHYWLGTDDALYAYDPLTGRSQQHVKFDCDKFNDMTSDNDGHIYISTFSHGFCIYDPTTGSLRNHDMNDKRDSLKGRLCNNWVMAMQTDRNGYLWLATSSGVSCYDPQTDNFRPFGWQVLLDGIMCYSLCETTRGDILIGTDQGLYIYYPEKKQSEAVHFPNSNELFDKVINYIVETANGDIWCSTSMGLWQYDISTSHFIGHVNGNGLAKHEYLLGVGLHTDDDHLYFGHNDGLTTFVPQNLKVKSTTPDSLQLTAFSVGNQFVTQNTVINGVKVTDRPVSQSNYFTLSYLDHTITMAFSQFTFDNPRSLTFEYRMGDEPWIRNPEGKNDFTLAHLQPGTYRIEVRAKQGVDYTPSKVIVVTIRAPWYRSTLAYFIYFVIIVSLLYYIQFTYRRRANQQMNEEKMKFLINATHDIRSPLTLIMAPIEKLKNGKIENLKSKEDIQTFNTAVLQPSIDTINRNAQRILNLVNQILDVRKIDKQQMHLHCQQTDLISFVRTIYKMFEYNAREHNITFSFNHGDLKRLDVWIDRSQFDKVVNNLLSNAFKYTNDGGTIEIRLSTTSPTGTWQPDNGTFCLQVLDSGVGLDSDNLKHIFDRFYQGGNSRRLHIDGTGIGLNLCKMIVDMHHGTIEASNRTDGQSGSVFTVTLPLGNKHLTNEEIETEGTPQPTESDVTATEPTGTDAQHEVPLTEDARQDDNSSEAPKQQKSVHTTPPQSHSSRTKKHVLLVDDDEEIGQYISTELSHYYKFGLCSNGKDGLKELLTNDYDVVISDVMMPEMDGFTMLRMIKANINISHIPVIMLTSKSDVGNRLEGLERGADAFLAKPFDMEELHVTIDSLIHNRQRLKGKYSGAQQQADKVEQPEVKGNDELLMERIMKAINKNLSDSDFSVDMLTQEVGISRAQLHRKMKELTGISTSEFIRNIRLEQAARLLKQQKINVTQVAYTVGFSNLAHFSTVFRKHFGISPSEYAEREA